MSRPKFIVKRQEKVSKHLFCAICDEIFWKPKVITCGHVFCKHCIEQWGKIEKTCPVCRRRFDLKVANNHLLAAHMVGEVKVLCNFEGCSWSGQMDDLTRHLQICLYKPEKLSALCSGQETLTPMSLFTKLKEKCVQIVKSIYEPIQEQDLECSPS